MRNASSLDRALVRATVAALVAATLTAGRASAQQVWYTGGVSGASGNYIFSQSTTTAEFSNGLLFSAGRVSFSAQIPVLYHSTPWVSQSGAGFIPTGGPQSGQAHAGRGPGGATPIRAATTMYSTSVVMPDTVQFDQVGLGDPTAFASLRVAGEPGTTATLTLSGGVKAPVASASSGFGTGEWDFGGGLAASLPFGSSALDLSAMYWSLGDMPDLVIDNPVSYDATLSHDFGTRYSLFGSVWGSSRTFADTDAPLSVGVGTCVLREGTCALGVTLGAGLTNASPDFSVGLTWQVPLMR